MFFALSFVCSYSFSTMRNFRQQYLSASAPDVRMKVCPSVNFVYAHMTVLIIHLHCDKIKYSFPST